MPRAVPSLRWGDGCAWSGELEAEQRFDLVADFVEGLGLELLAQNGAGEVAVESARACGGLCGSGSA